MQRKRQVAQQIGIGPQFPVSASSSCPLWMLTSASQNLPECGDCGRPSAPSVEGGSGGAG